MRRLSFLGLSLIVEAFTSRPLSSIALAESCQPLVTPQVAIAAPLRAACDATILPGFSAQSILDSVQDINGDGRLTVCAASGVAINERIVFRRNHTTLQGLGPVTPTFSRSLRVNGAKGVRLASLSPAFTSILAARLDLLTRLKLIERVHPELASRNNAYKLTKSGKALEPVIKDLGKWAGKHLSEYHSKIVQL